MRKEVRGKRRKRGKKDEMERREKRMGVRG
jgi:hypothetical protein